MEEYQYHPLPSANHIRLLTLHPGRFDDDTVVSFDVVSIKSDILPHYETLSYVWDKEHHPSLVHISEQRCTISVTRNLENALVHLRHPDRPRTMWIDALCINQNDDVEKGPQVAMMGSIYQLSTRITAWLGPECDESNRAMNTMTWIGTQVEADYERWIVDPSENCTHPSFLDMDADIPLRETETKAIYHLVSRKWFERLWIRQEVLLTESRAVVQCGLYQVPWPSFRRALLCLYMKRRPRSSFEDKLYQRLLALRGLIGQPSKVELGFIRVVFGQSDCADPRDRVYALLEFLPETDRAIVGVPDYTKDVMVIFREIMWRWILHFGSLNLLSQCEPPVDHPKSVPSWIPDWTKKDVIFGRNYWRTFASSQFGAACTLSTDGRVLTTPGVSVMKIDALDRIPVMKVRQVKEVKDILLSLLPTSGLSGEYPTGVSMLEAYARTFLANALAENAEPWRGEDPTLEEAKNIVSRLQNEKNDPEADHRGLGPSDAFFKIARAMLGGRQLMHGSEGYIGIVPSLAEEGDDICVLLGCHTPMVLRQVGDQFRIVGECYVFGISEGEAFVGPLPKQICRRFASNEKWGTHAYFENIETGERSLDDPRLPPSLDLMNFRNRLQEDPNSKIMLEPGVVRKWFPHVKSFEIS